MSLPTRHCDSTEAVIDRFEIPNANIFFTPENRNKNSLKIPVMTKSGVSRLNPKVNRGGRWIKDIANTHDGCQ